MASYVGNYQNSRGSVEPFILAVTQKTLENNEIITTFTTFDDDLLLLPLVLRNNLKLATGNNRNLICRTLSTPRFVKAYLSALVWAEFPIPFHPINSNWDVFWSEIKLLNYIEFDYVGDTTIY